MACSKRPLRMCVVCRSKIIQKNLLRLQYDVSKKLVLFQNTGRSFYICKQCEESIFDQKNEKKIEQVFFRICKNKDNYINQLKEILIDVR